MKRLVALVAGIAFSLGIGLAVPQTFAQAPAPKEDKKGEMTDKDKKGDKMDKKSSTKKKMDKKGDKMDKDKMDKTEKTDKKDDKK